MSTTDFELLAESLPLTKICDQTVRVVELVLTGRLTREEWEKVVRRARMLALRNGSSRLGIRNVVASLVEFGWLAPSVPGVPGDDR